MNTLPRALTWDLGGGDGGEIAAAVFAQGLIHSPGYPTYLIVAQLARFFPFEPFAFSLNVFSAAMTAISTGMIAYVGWHMASPRNRWLAAAGSGILWSLHEQVWTQAIIVEVYALAGVFYSLLFILAYRLSNPTSYDSKLWMIWGIVLGMGVGAHAFVVLAVPFLAIRLYHHMSWRLSLRGLVGFAVGLLVFLWLPLRAGTVLNSNWGNPDTWSRFWWVISGAAYTDRLNLLVNPSRVLSLIGLIVDQLTLIGVVLIAFGFAAWFEEKRDWAIVSSLVIIVNVWVVAAYESADILPYLFPSILIFALVAGEGIGTIAVLLSPYAKRFFPQRFFPHGRNPVGVSLLFLLTTFLLVQTLPLVSVVEIEAEHFGRSVIKDAPPRSIVISHGEKQSFSIRYAAAVERRNDLVLIDLDLLYFDWYREDIVEQLGYSRNTELNPIVGHPLMTIVPLISSNTVILSSVSWLPVPAKLTQAPNKMTYLVKFELSP